MHQVYESGMGPGAKSAKAFKRNRPLGAWCRVPQAHTVSRTHIATRNEAFVVGYRLQKRYVTIGHSYGEDDYYKLLEAYRCLVLLGPRIFSSRSAIDVRRHT